MLYGVLAFTSTHSAMQAEKHLRGRFSIQMMPTPRAITASCGISVRFLPEDLDGIRREMESLAGETDCWQAYGVDCDGSARPLGGALL